MADTSTFSPERAAELAMQMLAHTDLDEQTVKLIAVAIAEGEQAYNLAKQVGMPSVTVSRPALLILLKSTGAYAGTATLHERIDLNAN